MKGQFDGLTKEQQLEIKMKRVVRLINSLMDGNRDPILRKIYDEFGPRIFRRCSAPADFAEKLFREKMRGKGFKTAVEIGCLNGITAAVMSQYVDVVHTFDIIDWKDKYKIWKFLGVEKKIRFHLIKNELEKYDIINGLDFDIAYVDGNHVNCTWSDYLVTRKCGRIFLHEATHESSQPWELAEALPEKEITKWQFGPKVCSLVYWDNK